MLIAFEGLDGSGKKTQAELLFKTLAEKGIRVARYSFPRYESKTGKIIEYYLKDKFGSQKKLDALFPASLYAIDRLAIKADMINLLEENTWIVCERYVASNMAHQGSKGKTQEEQNIITDKIEKLEYGIYQLPRPDFTFFLDLQPKFAVLGIKRQDDPKSTHELNIEHQEKVYKTYKEIVKKHGLYKISCFNAEVGRKTPEELHEEIVNILFK